MLLVTAQLFQEKKPFLCQFGLLRCQETRSRSSPRTARSGRVFPIPSRTGLEESGAASPAPRRRRCADARVTQCGR